MITAAAYKATLSTATARAQLSADMTALGASGILIMLQPCGRSANGEFMWAVRAGMRTVIFIDGESEPELIHGLADEIVDNIDDLLAFLSSTPAGSKVYLASSWRNQRYSTVLAALRERFDVFDFRVSGNDQARIFGPQSSVR